MYLSFDVVIVYLSFNEVISCLSFDGDQLFYGAAGYFQKSAINFEIKVGKILKGVVKNPPKSGPARNCPCSGGITGVNIVPPGPGVSPHPRKRY